LEKSTVNSIKTAIGCLKSITVTNRLRSGMGQLTG
jgi:hypothetical protein